MCTYMIDMYQTENAEPTRTYILYPHPFSNLLLICQDIRKPCHSLHSSRIVDLYTR